MCVDLLGRGRVIQVNGLVCDVENRKVRSGCL